MSKDYPYETRCDNCNGQIFIYYSKNKNVEYARDSTVYINYSEGEKPDYHKCPNWRAKGKKTTTTQQKPISKVVAETTPPVTSKQAAKQYAEQPVLETGESVLKFERSFKIVEVTISKSRKCNEKTIPQLIGFQSIDYFISMKAEVEINTDFQRLIKEKFSAITQAIDTEIMADRLRLEGLEEK